MTTTSPSIPVIPVQDLWNPIFHESLKAICVPLQDAQIADIVALSLEMHSLDMGLNRGQQRGSQALILPSIHGCSMRLQSGIEYWTFHEAMAANPADKTAIHTALKACASHSYTKNATDLEHTHSLRMRRHDETFYFSLYRVPEGIISVLRKIGSRYDTLSSWIAGLSRPEAAASLVSVLVPQAASAHERLTQQSLLKPEGNLASLSRQLLAQHHPNISWLQEIPLRFAQAT